MPLARANRSHCHPIFTCGYQGRCVDDLLRHMASIGIEIVVDVRARAASRRPDFNRRRLSDSLSRADIEYLHLPELGVPPEMRADPAGRDEAFGWYADRLNTSPPAELAQVALLASQKTVLLLCYEASPADCHRHILAEVLSEQLAVETVHL